MNKIFLFFLFFLPLLLFSQEVYIYGQDTICSNSPPATVYLDFQNRGVSPYTVVYSIDNVYQDTIVTNLNLHEIKTKTPGYYRVEYFSDNVMNGIDSITGMARVLVNQSPTVQLFVSSDTISTVSPKVSFLVQSNHDIIQQTWNYGDNTGSHIISNPTHIYPTNDISALSPDKYFLTTLIVEDHKGCLDTTFYNIYMQSDYFFWVPNSFSPNNDGLNDQFCIFFNGIRETTFLFNIFNSSGSLVYATDNIKDISCSFQKGWDGRHYKSNELLSSDTYVYEIYFQDLEGWKHKKFGTIILAL